MLIQVKVCCSRFLPTMFRTVVGMISKWMRATVRVDRSLQDYSDWDEMCVLCVDVQHVPSFCRVVIDSADGVLDTSSVC